ncbi:hypothetical protein ACFX19_024971 [Malus domestica]
MLRLTVAGAAPTRYLSDGSCSSYPRHVSSEICFHSSTRGSSDACLMDFAPFKFHARVNSPFCTLLLEYINR